MIMHEQNGYLILAHLSDIELYYTSPEFIENEKITLQGEEFHHAVNVMRNYINDLIYITDGVGKIYECEIVEIGKSNLKTRITDEYQYECNAANIWFCIPVLKNPDRLKFAFEKCVELGITNFILFTSNRTIPKKINLDKYLKTTQAAMKQSLRAFLPKIISTSFDEINKLSGDKILFDQKVKSRFTGKNDNKKSSYFLFGPEGGFDESEISSIENDKKYCLSNNRLRSETAIVYCASLLKLP
jgi:16S rRNA (uracil1498-N3)-methyltransferase